MAWTGVSSAISTPSPSNVTGLLVAVAIAAALIGLLTLVQQMVLARVQTRLTVVGAFRLVDHLVHLPVQYFTQRYPGVLVSRLDQVDQAGGQGRVCGGGGGGGRGAACVCVCVCVV